MKSKQIKKNVTKYYLDDSLDTPDCFGEFEKDAKICSNHCAVSLNCIAEKINNPKIDILDKLINLEQYQIKPH